jgi:hypothetical protein
MINPRDVAYLGIGRGAALLSRIGLWLGNLGNYILFARRRGRR